MPNRILREGILTSPRMARLGWAEEVFYRRLMSVVDDFGRYYADAGMLRAACYPRQLNKVSDSDVGKWLQGIEAAGLVRVYPAQDGERYLEVLDFNQQVRAKKSKFPDMPSTCLADAAHAPANAHLDVFGVEDEEEHAPLAGSGSVEPAGFKAFWEAWPRSKRKEARGKCLDAWKRGKLEASAGVILAHVESWKATEEWQKQGGQFIPAPLVYLNGRRWDGAEAAAPAAKAAFEGAV